LDWLEQNPTLFILDGYDEVADNSSAILSNFFSAILSLKVSYLMTSRPLNIDKLENQAIRFNRNLECMGFTNENIKAFVKDYFNQLKKPDAIKPLLEFLEAQPSIWGTAHVPINLELISWAWSQGEFNQNLKTLTQLYQFIVKRRIEVEQDKPQDKIKLDGQAKLASAEIYAKLQHARAFLRFLAYHVMQQHSLILSGSFIREQLQAFLRTQQASEPELLLQSEALLSACYQLGLIKSTGEGGRKPIDQSHYFIHLSFQEFLAGEYVAAHIKALHYRQLDKEAREALITFIHQTKRESSYKVMWWFVAGALHEIEANNLPLLQTFFDLLLEEPRAETEPTELNLLVRCLDEAQMPAITRRNAILG
ncbi:MAG: NACHT domain-containing protein, partial [Burkholderiales bacterium]